MKSQELTKMLKKRSKSKSSEKTITRLLAMAKEASLESDQEAVELIEAKMEHMLHALLKHRERETQWYKQQLEAPLTHRMISGAMKDVMHTFGLSAIDKKHIPNVANRILGNLRTRQQHLIEKYDNNAK